MWILSVCLGILWGGMCDDMKFFSYPTKEACEFQMKKLNAKASNGYATCVPKEQLDSETRKKANS